MTTVRPIYTAADCSVAYQLNWSLSVFWSAPRPAPDWLATLQQATEPDAIRILEHHERSEDTSQFLASTSPEVAPTTVVARVKGRLQYILRSYLPKAFSRNYALRSVGSPNRQRVERYVADQLGHHRMADPGVQEKLERFQFRDAQVDLSQWRKTAHGLFAVNLHLVLVNDHRWHEIDDQALERTRRAIIATAAKRGHLLAKIGLFADHVHIAVGTGMDESPQDAALAYMNNIAFLHGMRAVLQPGYYVGTFGEYDLDAIHRHLRKADP